MLRTDTCLCCGDAFSAPYRHPMIEEAHCPECLVIVREMTILRFGVPRYWRPCAFRSDEV